MAATKVKNELRLRSIHGASRETDTAVTTLRAWDPVIGPYRIGQGPHAPRAYADEHIERIKQHKLVEERRRQQRYHGI